VLAVASGVAILFLIIAVNIGVRGTLLILIVSDRPADPALAGSASMHLHDLLLDDVNVLLAGSHPLDKCMVLLLEVLGLLIQLIILKSGLHELLLH
jgi:hypothetical protein